LEDAFKAAPPQIAIDHIPLRIVAERLQIPDLTDPALAPGPVGKRRDPLRLPISIRVVVAGVTVADAVIDNIDVAILERNQRVVDLDRVVYEGVVQSGESLLVEVVTGAPIRKPVATEQLRFKEMLDGDPSSWIGSRAPSRRQLWRLWYRIERTDGA
jgi:hypothetical protein